MSSSRLAANFQHPHLSSYLTTKSNSLSSANDSSASSSSASILSANNLTTNYSPSPSQIIIYNSIKHNCNSITGHTSSSQTISLHPSSTYSTSILLPFNNNNKKQEENLLLSIGQPKRRKQHTLDSLESESSRSRSPIVDTNNTTTTCAPSGQDQQIGELISLQSFERRRSIYEQPSNLKENAQPFNAASKLTPSGSISRRGAMISLRKEAPTTEDNLEKLSIDFNQTDEPLETSRLTMTETSTGSFHTAPMVSRSASETSRNSTKSRNCTTEQPPLPQQLPQEQPSPPTRQPELPKQPEAIQPPKQSGPLKKPLPQPSKRTPAKALPSNAKKGPIGNPAARAEAHEAATGFEIVWLNFTYSVEPNIFEDPKWGKINGLFHKERRMILKGLSGGLKSGQMVALMGPSGAGKTCLLECIAGTRVSGIGGEIKIRGKRSAQLVIVPQYDNFMPQFSVQEIITYGSRLKNPPKTDHRAAAEKVIKQLGLEVCRTNNIQQCSGGQRKRVAIAQELVSKPNILILDEPTSGLDSSCCYQTIKVLRDVLDESVKGEQPMTIVTTIHQPSAKVFKMFDFVYLLSKMGYAAYSGPPDQLLPTIRQVTELECPQYSNPSDYMIELVAYDYGQEPVEKLIEYEKEKAKKFVADYEKRASSGGPSKSSPASLPSGGPIRVRPNLPKGPLKSSKSDTQLDTKITGQYPLNKLKNDHSSSDDKGNTELIVDTQKYVKYKDNVSVSLKKATLTANARKRPFFWHTLVHIHRSFLQSIRDPILNNMRILIHLGFASLLVLLYGKKSGEARGCPPVLGLPIEITDPNNESMIDLADNVGYLFMCVMLITYVSLMSTVLTFPIDIKTVGKEYKNGWYGTLTYFLGKTIADLPFIIGYPFVYCLITWYLTNQAQDHLWRFFSFTGLVIINAMNSQSFGLILGAVFVNSVTAATFLGPVITIPWYLFTGFTKRIHRLAEPYKSTSKFLFTRYVYEGILDTVYGHERCNCSKFLQSYEELRLEEAVRLGQMISAETLSSLDYYDSFESVANLNETQMASSGTGGGWLERTVDAASTVFANGDDLNLAGLMATNDKASNLFSFGLDFEPTCPADYRNFVTQDFRLDKQTAENAFFTTLLMLVALRLITFIVVTWKIRTRQL